jgi:chemotaxis protein histidine kinase CheA
MTFDEELRRAFDTLIDRFRDELDRHARSAAEELAQSARAARDEAVAQAEAAARAAADARAEEAARESTSAIAEAAAAARAEAAAQAEEALRTARDAAAQSEEALRAAREEAAKQTEEAVRAAREEAAAHADHALRAHEAEMRARAEADASAKAAAPASDAASLAHLADGIRRMAAATSLGAVLEALVDAASVGTTAGIWLLRGERLISWSPAPSRGDGDTEEVDLHADRAVAAAARNNAPALRDGMEQAFPLTLVGEVVAVVGISAARGGDGRLPGVETLEILARYASRALEAITAFKTARAIVQAPLEPSSAPSGLSDEASSAEEQASAQRYAKLLVCEIKLYHEAEVVEGRRDRDLVARLGGEIAHARVMYEQRVPPHVRERADYFHEELVRTLADGDETLLEVRT